MNDTISDDPDLAAALKLRDAACSELIAELQAEADEAEAGADKDEIASFVTETFGKFFAASRRKKEPAEVAAPKIAKIIAKQTRKKFAIEKIASEPEPAAEAETSPAAPAAEGPVARVTGKTTGIDRKILNVLNEVSAFFDKPIAVISGLRVQKDQAMALYTNWQSHLRRGKDNAWLAKNEKLRLQLDDLKQAKNRDGFIDLLNRKGDWKALSRHLTGDEVDLPASTDPEIVEAIATCLNHTPGRNSEGDRCHHFDNSTVIWPITDATREKWKP